MKIVQRIYLLFWKYDYFTKLSVYFSFGENVRLVHDFSEQFSNQSGAKLLQHFTFEQKKTKIAQVRIQGIHNL